MKHRSEEAFRSLHYVRDGSFTEEEIEDELHQIRDSVSIQLPIRTRWIQLFTKPDLFRRLWRAALLQFMAQMCGATAMKYYLPTLFRKLGLGYRLSLMVGGIESTLKIGCTIIEMLIVDRVGRRNTMVAGALVMGIAMLVSLPLEIVRESRANRSRSTEHCRLRIRTMPIALRIMPASSLFSSTRLGTRWASDPELGSTVARYDTINSFHFVEY
jgi:hypothetical protein